MDERPESADFAPVQVGGRGRRGHWAPMLAAGWVVVLAAVVALGALGRAAPAPVSSLPSAVPAAVGPVIRFGINPRQQPAGPTRTSDPNLVALSVSTLPSGVAVSGTILSRSVVWVFVSVQDEAGAVQAWRSLSVEDPDGGIRPSLQPAFAIQIDLPAPTATSGLLWVEANAYNSIGRKVGSARQAFGPGIEHDSIRISTSLVR
jgi:hypothetical protein